MECLEVQDCLNPQYDSTAQSPAANMVMDWWDDGKLDVSPSCAIMKDNSCLGTAPDQANIFFAWMIGEKAEGIPY